jgi:mannose-6-phosphate isomerase-like protein (cupin superfamily)
MNSFKGNIEKLTESNPYFRKVLYTNSRQQLVLMSISPRSEIGMETHPKTSQFIRIESGKGKAIVGDTLYLLRSGDAIVIPPNTKHNITNTSATDTLQLYTIYSPPEHEEGLIEI